MQEGELDEAIQYFDKAIQINKKYPEGKLGKLHVLLYMYIAFPRCSSEQ